MKKSFLVAVFMLICCVNASAKVRLPYCTDCMYTVSVADFPDSAAFYSKEYNAFADLGYVHKQFWAVWIPLWNYDGQYALVVKGQDVYYELSEADLKAYAETYHLDLPQSPISLWGKLGGKAIIAIIVMLGIWAYSGEKKKEAGTESVKTEAESQPSGN